MVSNTLSSAERESPAELETRPSPFLSLPAWARDLLMGFLAGFYPLAFALSNNWYMLTAPQRWFLLAAIPSATALATLAVSTLGRVVLRLIGRPTATAYVDALVGALSAAIISMLLFGAFADTVGKWGAAALSIAIVCGVAVLAFRQKQQAFVAVVAFTTGVALVQLTYSYLHYRFLENASIERLVPDSAKSAAALKFKTKPNVYFMIYDGYGNRQNLQQVYGLDNDAHYKALEERGFRTFDALSNYWGTFSTVMSIFMMGHHYYDLATGVEDSRVGRSFMSSADLNPTLKGFVSNGYDVRYVHPSQYLFAEQGAVSFAYPKANIAQGLEIFSSPFLRPLVPLKSGHVKADAQTKVIYHLIDHPGRKPTFNFFHFKITNHSPNDAFWSGLKKFEATYRGMVANANKHMLALFDKIQKHDPDALIIVIGDHGGWRYRGILKEKPNDPIGSITSAGLSPETIALDMVGVITAVKAPPGCEEFFYPTISPVNLMRGVMGCLSEDKSVLAGRVPDVSYTGTRFKIGQDGKILPEWSKIKKK